MTTRSPTDVVKTASPVARGPDPDGEGLTGDDRRCEAAFDVIEAGGLPPHSEWSNARPVKP